MYIWVVANFYVTIFALKYTVTKGLTIINSRGIGVKIIKKYALFCSFVVVVFFLFLFL